jgi:hypothetical protein
MLDEGGRRQAAGPATPEASPERPETEISPGQQSPVHTDVTTTARHNR